MIEKTDMPELIILPSQLRIEAKNGETLMEAAWRHGLYWPTTCGGQGICTSCLCVVESGQENLEAASRSERKTLVAELGERAQGNGRLRLACQARVRGNVTVTKRGVRASAEASI